MKMSVSIRTTFALLMAGILLVACKKGSSNNSNGSESPEVEAVTAYDDLAYFQRTFVDAKVATETTDYYEAGETISVAFCVGEAIYENDATNLYIGVDNLEEALAYWNACLAPDIARTTSADNNYNYTLTDMDGKSQGTVSFEAGADGNVAVITPALPNLQYFEKITFILNSAWPFNSGEARNHLGDIRRFSVPVAGDVTFVCIRERSNGVKPFYAAITKDKFLANEESRSQLFETKWCPGGSKALSIYDLLHTDWDFFVAAFEEAGGGKLDEEEACWYDDKDRYPFSEFQHGIKLYVEERKDCQDRWDTFYRRPHKRVLLKVDWLDEDALYYVPGDNTGGLAGEEAENIFDGQKGTKWCTTTDAKKGSSFAFDDKKCWFIEFQTYEASDPSGYVITNADSAKKRYYRNPKEWALLGKKNLSDAGWTILDKRTDVDLPHNDSATSSFEFNTTTGEKDWKYFRLEVTEINGNGTCMQFSGFKFNY